MAGTVHFSGAVDRQLLKRAKIIAAWVKQHQLPIVSTKTYQYYCHNQTASAAPLRKSNLGELAVQEAMNDFALRNSPPTGIFLFEDHKVARTSFLLPDNCRKVSARAFLIFLEQKGWLQSAVDVGRTAIQNGCNFSALRFSAA